MRFLCCKKKAGRDSATVAPAAPNPALNLTITIPPRASQSGGGASGTGFAAGRYVLTEGQAAARAELERILEASGYRNIKLAEDKDKKSLTITGAPLEKYEPMMRAAINYFKVNFSGQNIVIRAFQSPSFLKEGKEIGDCVSLSFYREKEGVAGSTNLILYKESETNIRILSAEDYERLCIGEDLAESPRAVAGAGAGGGAPLRGVAAFTVSARPPRPMGSGVRSPLPGKGVGFLKHTGTTGSAVRGTGAALSASGDGTSPMATAWAAAATSPSASPGSAGTG